MGHTSTVRQYKWKIPFELSSHIKKNKNVIYGIECKYYYREKGACDNKNKEQNETKEERKKEKNVKLIKCENLYLLKHGFTHRVLYTHVMNEYNKNYLQNY